MTAYTSSTATINVGIPNAWNSGFVANFSITAEQAISGWQIEFQFSGTIPNMWGAQIVSHIGDTYIVQSLGWNANLSAGQTVSFGFVASGDPDDIELQSINGDGFGDDANDLATFTGNRDDYSITQIDDTTVEITGPEGTQLFSGVTSFEFADLTQTFDELLIPRLANLEASGITLTDASLAPEESTFVTVEIASNGTIGADATTAELLIATNPNSASIIGSFGTTDIDAIGPQASRIAQFELSSADLAPGTYWVAVKADSGDALTEEDETDNLTEWSELVIEAPVADLKLVAADLGDATDLDLEGGGQIEMDYVIENASNASFSYMVVRSYLSTDAVVSADDKAIAGLTGGTFPGMTISPSTSHYFQDDFTPGEYYLISVIEWGDGTVDATPEDNIVIQTITFEAPPEPVIDIAVTDVQILGSSDLEIGANGGVLNLLVDLANLGDIASQAGLTVTLSVDDTASADDLTLWTDAADIAAGGTSTLNIAAMLDEGIGAGDYTVFVTASTDGDLDIGNNVGQVAVQFTVPVNPGTEGDDIWVSDPLEPATVDLLGGADIAIAGLQADVVNGGAGIDLIDFSQITEGMELTFGFISGELSPELGIINEVFGIQASPHTTFAPTSYWIDFEAIIATDLVDYIVLEDADIDFAVDAGAGDDLVQDGSGDDIVMLGSGDDFLFNWLGDDVITTGAGSDVVNVIRDSAGDYFDASSGPAGVGHDIIDDFDVSEDFVFVMLTSDEEYDPFADVIQTDDGALLQYADDSSLLLAGVDVDALSAANFSTYLDESNAVVGSITG